MTTYHSEFTDFKQSVGNMAIVPLRTKYRGPAPQAIGGGKDIIDEGINYFKALVFFRNYEIKSEADRVLIYIVLYIIECLKKLQRSPNKTAGAKELVALGIAQFDIPGDPSFPRELNALYAKPKSKEEGDQMRQYIQQIRQETGLRLIDKVFAADNEPPSKWWMCFSRKKFLDQSLSAPGMY